MKNLISIITVLLIIFVVSGCGKEELPITSTPIEQLTSSYVVLGESTIELPNDMHNSIILERTANSLKLKKDAVLSGLSIGGFLVSSIETEREDFLFRKIIEIDSSGGELNLITVPANVVQAYKGYYIDSKLSGLISSREPDNLSTVFKAGSSVFSDIIATALDNDKSKWSISIDYVIEGIPNFKAIHPNTAYEIFADDSNIDKTDTDNDSLWNVTESYFSDLNSVIDSNGLYTIEIAEFGIQKIQKNLKYSLTPENDLKDIDGLGVGDMAEKIKMASKALSDKKKKSSLSFKYFPVGSIGVFTVNAVLGPVLEIGANCSLFMDYLKTYENRITIQFGHLNWNSSIPDADIDIKFIADAGTSQERDVNFSSVFEDPSTKITGGINGEMDMKMGFSVGVAGSTGEANTVGASIGFLIPITVDSKFTAQGAVTIPEVKNFSYENTAVSGQICTDVSIGASVIVFSDANISVTVLGDLLDYQLQIPPNLLPPLSLSLFSGNENYTDDGLCWGYDRCSPINLTQFDIALDDNGSDGKRLEFTTQADLTDSFDIEISTGTSTMMIEGPFVFNQRHTRDLFISDAFIAGITDGTFEVKISIKSVCDKSFKPEVGLFVNGCDNTYRAASDDLLDYKATNLSGETISYFTYDNATTYMSNLSAALPTLAEAQEFIEASCSNPTGWRIVDPNSGGYRFVNRSETYVWIQRESNLDNILKVSYSLDGSEFSYDFETFNAASSVMAALIN